jgi:hypothetical protein
VLVTSAQAPAIDEAIWFRRTLQEGGLPFAGMIVNRYHHDVIGEAAPAELTAVLGEQLPAGLAARVAANFQDYHLLARRDRRNVARLVEELGDDGGRAMILVPHLDDDVHDIAGLGRVARYLFASDDERRTLVAELVA